MKTNIVYLAIAILIGILIGYFIFRSDVTEDSLEKHDHPEVVVGQIWTCSMHPQIKQPEFGDCPICGMELIQAEGDVDGLSIHQFKMTENALALANIQTSMVGEGGVDPEEVTLSGKMKVNENANTVQVTHFSGRIEKLLISSIGEQVRKGQVVAMIYSPELVAAQQELLTTTALKATQPELYKAVRNKLKLKKLSDAQINQIESSGTIKETFPLHAHVSGIVSEKMVEEGNHIAKGDVLIKVADLSTVWASFDAYENQISMLKIGQKIQITTNAYPNRVFDATISFIDPVLNTATRTVVVRAELKNNASVFKPGMFIKGVVFTTTELSKKTIMLPKSAVLWTGERSVVYVKTRSDTSVFEMREVVLGDAKGDQYVIVEGIQEGEEVVTNGAFTVDAAAQLLGKKSMMNKEKKRDSTGYQAQEGARETVLHLSESFQKKFTTILDSYFDLKDAFVIADSSIGHKAEKLLDELQYISESSGIRKPEQTFVDNSIKALEHIISKQEIAYQRAYFVTLNENLIILSNHVDDPVSTWYVQKCPMANRNKGASWLSKEKEIRNPYFGSKMLTCGAVIDTVLPK